MRMLTITIVLCAVLAAPAAARPYPERIPLPNGWAPEGIAVGFGDQFFAGSRTTGAIFKGNLRTGKGRVLVPARDGGAALGMKVDHRNRLFVAGGGTGTARVYQAGSGRLLRKYVLTPAPTFINDVTLTHDAAYFTDSVNQQLYVLDLGRHGRLPAAARTLPLTGDLQYDDNPQTFELNGIAATDDGRLISVQSRTASLYLIDPRTGDTDAIALTGGDAANGDGLLLFGPTLYVVQNQLNRIAVVRLDTGLESGTVVRHITDSDFDVPTTIAARAGFLWAVNARFSTPVTPDTAYDVVRVSA
jgi:sugar lactone lactonase YvrE